MTLNDNERMTIIRYYAKIIIEHNLMIEEVRRVIERLNELCGLSGEKN
jgi:hypothetical protein